MESQIHRICILNNLKSIILYINMKKISKKHGKSILFNKNQESHTLHKNQHLKNITKKSTQMEHKYLTNINVLCCQSIKTISANQ